MILLVDIDHTLADAHWRDPMIDLFGWDTYHEKSIEDFPIEPSVRLVNALFAEGWKVYGFTARPERYRRLTLQWLINHSIPVDRLIMRGDEDWRPSHQVKSSHLEALIPKEDRLKCLVIDDREDICCAVRDQGFLCLQVYWNANSKHDWF